MGLVLVDTGLPGSEKRILSAVRKLGKAPREVKLVLLTHRHIDHIGSVAALKKETGATLASHQFEKPYVAGTLTVQMPAAWSLQGRITKRLLSLGQSMATMLRLIKFHPIHIDRVADSDSILEEVGLDGTILWTPGHTKGSVSLFLNKPKVAIVGDLLRSSHGKLVEPLLMESIPQVRASVRRVLELSPVLICPGHGKPLPSSAVKVSKKIVTPVPVRKKEKEEGDLDELTSDLFKVDPQSQAQ
jgi:glyoxylase-like metal-dependent hydrolase (beta-lactamase superfamily II)